VKDGEKYLVSGIFVACNQVNCTGKIKEDGKNAFIRPLGLAIDN